MKKSFTSPDLARFRTLSRVPSSSQLSRIKSVASLNSTTMDRAMSDGIENITNVVQEIVQDIGDPRGIAGIVCLETHINREAPLISSKISDESEDLERCLHIPTDEEVSQAEPIWRNIVFHKMNRYVF